MVQSRIGPGESPRERLRPTLNTYDYVLVSYDCVLVSCILESTLRGTLTWLALPARRINPEPIAALRAVFLELLAKKGRKRDAGNQTLAVESLSALVQRVVVWVSPCSVTRHILAIPRFCRSNGGIVMTGVGSRNREHPVPHKEKRDKCHRVLYQNRRIMTARP